MDDELTNPALSDLVFLVGHWQMALSDASFLPDPNDVVHGHVEFLPIERGALLAMRQGADPPSPPGATWVIGRDDSSTNYTVLYADSRGVARVYEMTFTHDAWRLWRDDPDFSQRFEATVSPDRRSIVGRWEKRASGSDWEHDFTVSYTRLISQQE